jgi:hypothetical protein
MFSDPLPDSVVSTLRTDETAALAAAMIVAGAFHDIASFAARVAGAPYRPPDGPQEQPEGVRGKGAIETPDWPRSSATSRASPSRRCLAG